MVAHVHNPRWETEAGESLEPQEDAAEVVLFCFFEMESYSVTQSKTYHLLLTFLSYTLISVNFI